jgi:rhodanese-related sulfurtransferase
VIEFSKTLPFGAVHIPLHDLRAPMAELADRAIWVHCQSGLPAGAGLTSQGPAAAAVPAVSALGEWR